MSILFGGGIFNDRELPLIHVSVQQATVIACVEHILVEGEYCSIRLLQAL